MSLIGAVYGALLVNYGKTVLSESYPELWLFLMGGLFIAVVMFFPNGLAGIDDKYGKKLFTRKLRKGPASAMPSRTLSDPQPGPVRDAASLPGKGMGISNQPVN